MFCYIPLWLTVPCLRRLACRIFKILTWVQSQAIPCGICGGKSDTATGLSPSPILFSLSESFHQCSILTDLSITDALQLQKLTASLNSALKKNIYCYLRISLQPFEVINKAPSCVSQDINSIYMYCLQHLLQMLLKLYVNCTCTSPYCLYIQHDYLIVCEF